MKRRRETLAHLYFRLYFLFCQAFGRMITMDACKKTILYVNAPWLMGIWRSNLAIRLRWLWKRILCRCAKKAFDESRLTLFKSRSASELCCARQFIPLWALSARCFLDGTVGFINWNIHAAWTIWNVILPIERLQKSGYSKVIGGTAGNFFSLYRLWPWTPNGWENIDAAHAWCGRSGKLRCCSRPPDRFAIIALVKRHENDAPQVCSPGSR